MIKDKCLLINLVIKDKRQMFVNQSNLAYTCRKTKMLALKREGVGLALTTDIR